MKCPAQNVPFSSLGRRHITHNGVKHFLFKILHFDVAQTSIDIMTASAAYMTASVTILGQVKATSKWDNLFKNCAKPQLQVDSSFAQSILIQIFEAAMTSDVYIKLASPLV